MHETALEYGVEALKLEPDDKRLLDNISFYERKVTL
jgi:hypothetical protein